MKLNGKSIQLSVPEDQGSRIAFKDIFLDDVYGLCQLPQSVRTVLDVGAHAGLFSLYARTLFPGATIHAYEPNKALRPHLQQHSSLAEFRIFSEAVGGRAGVVKLIPGDDSVFTRTCEGTGGDIAQISIDEAIDRLGGEVDLLKLDCEGCEWSVFEKWGCVRKVRFLRMEYHLTGYQHLEDLKKLICVNGFHITFVREDGNENGRIWAHR